jgi:teichuronic acid biosynthesis glycosyltransferase TuaH
VAVYVGTLHADRLDVDLCVRTAGALDGVATVVLVGPNALAEGDTRVLREAGVVLLGAKPHEQVPAYLQHADVLLVPHVVTPFTDSLDPLKLYEYQAVARPVVATPVAGFRDSDDTHTTVAGDSTFADAVADALTQRNSAAPTAEVLGIDWVTRASVMGAALNGVLRPAPTHPPD